MWPFTKKVPPAPPPPEPPVLNFGTTDLQVGDECVCVDDEPHRETHQKLLTVGRTYKVRDVTIARPGDRVPGPYGGPWIKVEGVLPIGDSGWLCRRFKKVKKETIIEQVSVPADLDIKKEKADAY